jgi:HEAT repeat protein
LGRIKDNAEVAAALSRAAQKDAFWAVRVEAVRALAQLGGPEAQQHIVTALSDDSVAVRRAVVEAMGRFKDDPNVVARIEKIYREDKAWRVREAALGALARQKPAHALDALKAAIDAESPDDILRNQALQSIGGLGKDEAVPLLLEWARPGRPDATRRAAIGSLSRLDVKNKELTAKLLDFLREPRRSVNFQFTVFGALVQRGDTSALEAMEQWLSTGTSEMLGNFMRPMLAQLKAQGEGEGRGRRGGATAGDATPNTSGDASNKMILDALQRLENALAVLDERVKKIEEKVAKP